MTDEDMATFLGFAPDEPKRIDLVKALTPEKRAVFERMAVLEREWSDWILDKGPMPHGVIIKPDRKGKHR